MAPLFGWKQRRPLTPDEALYDPYRCEVTKQLGYVLFSASGSFYIPMVIIVAVYWRVYREALRQSLFFETGVKNTRKSQVTKEMVCLGVCGCKIICSKLLNKLPTSIATSLEPYMVIINIVLRYMYIHDLIS